jgi:hypothetical protein
VDHLASSSTPGPPQETHQRAELVLRNQIIGEKIKIIGTNDPLDYEYSTILQYTFMYNTKNNIFRFYATVRIHYGELLAFEEASTVTCTEKPNHW